MPTMSALLNMLVAHFYRLTLELDVLHLKPLMREKKLSNETKC